MPVSLSELYSQEYPDQPMNSKRGTPHHPVIIAHGGAWEIPTSLQQDAIDGCSEAAAAGWDVLINRGSALDAVETAVRILEDDPTFDAGYGSVLNAQGEIELDAIIVDGQTLELGAVIAVKHVRHPVTLARLVMTSSSHNILACEGAEQFARQHGVPPCPSWELAVARQTECWRAEASTVARTGVPSAAGSGIVQPGDTVGAVALDVEGHVAAATSTGGTFNKHPGRVGDSPLIGCGAYADDRVGAVSATGEGEHLMKIIISKTACDFLDTGMTAQEAADAAIERLTERTDGRGGVIVLGKHGDIGLAHNTSCLAYAHIVRDGMTSDIHV